MKIPSPKYLKKKAALRLESGQQPDKVILVYAAITLILSFLVTAVRYALGTQIAQTGGLQNTGIRSILSTMDRVLPILQTLIVMCLDLGYVAAMLRIARHQYASPMTLKAGAERFWVLVRTRLLLGLIYFSILFPAFYIACMLFMMTPLSAEFMTVVEPLLSTIGSDPYALAENEALMQQILPTMLPLFVIYGVLVLGFLLPAVYRYRLADYLLIEQPQAGAANALRLSRILMRGNVIAMLKLDLSFWWYWLLQAAASLLLYADLLLNAVGFDLSPVVAFFGSVILYLIGQFAIYYYLKNRVSVAYALAYDSLIPKKQPETGAVLGNIFQQ